MLDVNFLDAKEPGAPRTGHSQNSGSLPRNFVKGIKMTDYRFSLVVPTGNMTEEDILDATDALGAVGCTDASIRGHAQGMELLFERQAESLQWAISSAVADVERAGFHVNKVEIEREEVSA